MDLDKLREKLNQLKNPRRGGGKRTWTPPTDSKAVVRLVNYPHTEEEDPFPELWFHYRIGKGLPILCPRNNKGLDCPICEFGSELYNEGTEKDKELAKSLFPRQRTYAVVFDRSEDALTPKFWGFGVGIHKKLIESLLDPEYAHFLNPDTGIDLKVWREEVEGKQWPETQVKFARSDSALSDDAEAVKAALESIPTVEEVFKPLTKSEIETRLKEWLSFRDSDGDPEEKSTESVRKNKKKDNAKIEEELEKALADATSDDDTSEDHDVEEELEKALAEAEA
jgi:hypothetical protein